MKPLVIQSANGQGKTSTGIAGFDEITGGGLPRGRTTLLVGGPGSGKTIFALQFLVHGAEIGDDPGIFVAFEENSDRIVANAAGFGWKLATLRQTKLFLIDAQPTPDLVLSGAFDLGGMLAALDAKTSEMNAKRIVFDALDIVLALMPDEETKRREVYRLHAWLLDRQLTGIITAKSGGDALSTDGEQPFGFMQFMVDCAVVLNHRVVQGVSQRTVRVQKYRGSSFDENESPFLIGKGGFEVVVASGLDRGVMKVSKERVSSGVERLDTMLGGGYYRGATVLVTGFPGTAKTTLSGAFAEAACLRDERTLFVSFDTDSNEVIRDLGSVGIRLNPHVERGMLRVMSARSVPGSAEGYLIRIKTLAAELGARCVIIDPVSTWTKSNDVMSALSIFQRLIDWSKSEGITLLCTSLIDELSHRQEGVAPLRISTLADT
ncbi:MAG: ATPase domain-containing protein [Rhodanobacter sp.]